MMAARQLRQAFRGQLRRPASSSSAPRRSLPSKRAYKRDLRSGKTIEEVLPVLSEMAQSEPAIQLYVDFLKDNERGIIRASDPLHRHRRRRDLRRHPGRTTRAGARTASPLPGCAVRRIARPRMQALGVKALFGWRSSPSWASPRCWAVCPHPPGAPRTAAPLHRQSPDIFVGVDTPVSISGWS